jgi:hypothetical protein
MRNDDVNQFIHPETKPSEIFFTNAHLADFSKMEFKTKRLGEQAYDGNGAKLSNNDWYPVFLNQSEIKESGKLLSDLRKEFRKNS